MVARLRSQFLLLRVMDRVSHTLVLCYAQAPWSLWEAPSARQLPGAGPPPEVQLEAVRAQRLELLVVLVIADADDGHLR